MTAPGETTSATRRALRQARSEASRLPTLVPGTLGRIGVGVATAIVALIVKAVLGSLSGGDLGFVILVAAAVVGAWFGGLPGGIATTVVAGLVDSFVLTSDGLAFARPSGIALFRLIVFVFEGVILSALVDSLRNSRDRLAGSLADIAALATDIERRDARLELVLAASGTGFWEWDVVSGGLVWSDTIFAQHGLEPADGAPTYDRYLRTIHPGDRASFERSIQEALDRHDTFDHEFRIQWPDGSVHWTHGVGQVFRGADGTPLRLVGTGQDITERRRLEEERDRLLADERRAGTFREAFVDVISHELRTPITTILGLTQILRRPGHLAPGSPEVELVEDISAESERLHRLVEDLLVLTRAERGQLAIESEPLELRRILERLVSREAPRLPTLRITTEIDDYLPIVNGEQTYVEQIVRNMLGNAAKYTPPGTACVVRVTHEDDVVVVRVLDSGPGIDKDAAEQVFELFFRDPLQARTVAGSGIGLFVCASLVKAMGGRIWAQRRDGVGGGSEFGFTLTVLSDDESLIDASSAPDRSRAAI